MRTHLMLIACLAVAGGAGPAAAQTAGGGAGAGGVPPNARVVFMACRSDIKTFCAGVEPGEGRIAACMAEHKDQLGQGCKDALAKAKQGR